jgi:hypothetical protein
MRPLILSLLLLTRLGAEDFATARKAFEEAAARKPGRGVMAHLERLNNGRVLIRVETVSLAFTRLTMEALGGLLPETLEAAVWDLGYAIPSYECETVLPSPTLYLRLRIQTLSGQLSLTVKVPRAVGASAGESSWAIVGVTNPAKSEH